MPEHGGFCAVNEIEVQPLSPTAFAPFGDVLEAGDISPIMINDGLCARYSDLTKLVVSGGGDVGLSLFDAEARVLPLQLQMVERHPLGSQAFLPTTLDPFLVIVAAEQNGRPATPKAFITAPGQGVNYFQGTWHGVLTPLVASKFFVIDRIGPGANLEEHWFTTPYTVISLPTSEPTP